jgi:hypothetical protein
VLRKLEIPQRGAGDIFATVGRETRLSHRQFSENRLVSLSRRGFGR